jgi:hypothetical protein
MDKVQRVQIVSVNFSHAVFCLLSTHDDLVMQAFIWFRMVRFRAIWFGVVGFCVSCKFQTA